MPGIAATSRRSRIRSSGVATWPESRTERSGASAADTDAQLKFAVKEDTPATVVLTRYRGEGDPEQPGDVVRIPVILRP